MFNLACHSSMPIEKLVSLELLVLLAITGHARTAMNILLFVCKTVLHPIQKGHASGDLQLYSFYLLSLSCIYMRLLGLSYCHFAIFLLLDHGQG